MLLLIFSVPPEMSVVRAQGQHNLGHVRQAEASYALIVYLTHLRHLTQTQTHLRAEIKAAQAETRCYAPFSNGQGKVLEHEQHLKTSRLYEDWFGQTHIGA